MRILVKRSGALGDVLMTTPIVERLRMENPVAEIDVETGCQEVYRHNAAVNTVRGFNNGGYDRVIDLDMAYEQNPRNHVVNAYMLKAFGDTDGNKSIQFSYDRGSMKLPVDPKKLIAIHPAVAWRNRTMSRLFWELAIERITERGYSVVVLGSARDHQFATVPRIYSMSGKTGLRETADIINQCAAFICSDSALLHLAGATDTPIIAIFTCVRAEYRVPWRNGALGHKVLPFTPKMDCYGCLADAPAPVTHLDCRLGTNACTEAISAVAVADAAVMSATLLK